MGLAAVALVFDRALGDSLAFAHAQKFWDRAVAARPARRDLRGRPGDRSNIDGLTAPRGRVRTPGEPFSIADTLELQQAQLAIFNLVDLLALAAAIALTVVA